MQASNLFAASTYFCPPKKASLGQATYISKSGNSGPAQIDYILISKQWLSSVRSSKVVWGQTISRHGRRFDHGMVSAVLHLRVSVKRVMTKCHDRAWLKDKVNAQAFNEAYILARQTETTAETVEGATVSQDYSQLTTFLRSAMKSIPLVKNQNQGEGSAHSAR